MGNHKYPKMKITTTLILITLLLCVSFVEANEFFAKDIKGEICDSDSDCDAPYIICDSDSKTCQHKSLWVPHWRESIGFVVLIVLCMLANAVGIGGGALFVSILIFFFRMTAKEAIDFSNAIIFANSVATYVMVFLRKHPNIPHRTLIDYSLVIIMAPTITLGSLVGQVIGSIVPTIVQLVLLAFLLLVSVGKTLHKGIKLWK